MNFGTVLTNFLCAYVQMSTGAWEIIDEGVKIVEHLGQLTENIFMVAFFFRSSRSTVTNPGGSSIFSSIRSIFGLESDGTNCSSVYSKLSDFFLKYTWKHRIFAWFCFR